MFTCAAYWVAPKRTWPALERPLSPRSSVPAPPPNKLWVKRGHSSWFSICGQFNESTFWRLLDTKVIFALHPQGPSALTQGTPSRWKFKFILLKSSSSPLPIPSLSPSPSPWPPWWKWGWAQQPWREVEEGERHSASVLNHQPSKC